PNDRGRTPRPARGRHGGRPRPEGGAAPDGVGGVRARADGRLGGAGHAPRPGPSGGGRRGLHARRAALAGPPLGDRCDRGRAPRGDRARAHRPGALGLPLAVAPRRRVRRDRGDRRRGLRRAGRRRPAPAAGGEPAAARPSIRGRRRRMIARPARWLDERLGLSRFTRTALDKVFPDHWSFLLGEIAFYAFIVLVATGVFLT